MMSRPATVTIGSTVFYDEQDCVVEGMSFTPNDAVPTLRLRGDDGTLYVVLLHLVADAYSQVSAPADEPDQNPRLILEGLPDAVIAEAEQRLGHIRDLQQAEGLLKDRIATKAAALGIANRTVERWWSDYQKEGLWGLIDQRKVPHGLGPARIDERVREAMLAAAEGETDDSTGTRKRLYRRTQRLLNEKWGEDAVPMPSEPTFNRYCVDLFSRRSPYLFGDATTRRTNAASPDGPYQSLTVRRPGERVEFDTTRLDILAWDPIEDVVQSVELTATLDVCTRSVLAYRLTPVGTGAVDAALLLADILRPMTMREHWDEALRLSALQLPIDRLVDIDERIEHAAALPTIVPETVVIDHGKAFMSRAFQDSCQRLGISIAPARIRRATDKAKLERWFRTLGTMFNEHVAGYKSPSVARRGKDVEANAYWTIADLEELLDEFIVSVYQRRKHQGLVLPGHPGVTLSPNEAYAEAVHRTGIVMMPHDPHLYFDLLPTEWREIGQGGVVTVKSLTYVHEVLHRYQTTASPYEAKRGKWPFKYDPRNRNFIYFQDPQTGTWHPIRWVHTFDETAPFTDRTHAFVVQRLKDGGISRPHESQVAEALRDLQNRTDLPSNELRKRKRRVVRDTERLRHAQSDSERGGLHVAEPDPEPATPPPSPAGKERRPIEPAPIETFNDPWDQP